MKRKPSYTQDDMKGIVSLVSVVVGHPVDCYIADAEYMGVRNATVAYQIMPAVEVKHKSPVEEFWWQSDYSDTRQFYDSPIAAGLHYARHYVDFIAKKADSISKGQLTDLSHVRHSSDLTLPLA